MKEEAWRNYWGSSVSAEFVRCIESSQELEIEGLLVCQNYTRALVRIVTNNYLK